MFLSSILLGNGIYSIIPKVNAQENQTGTDNEAKINTDIEQENKCKKDTECENENELNNKLSNNNIIQSTEESLSPEQTCEDCFSILSQQKIEDVLIQFNLIVTSDTKEDPNIQTLEDLCNFLESTTTYEREYDALELSLSTNSVPNEQISSILQCLVDLGLISPTT